mgnify:CR=1 FL=1
MGGQGQQLLLVDGGAFINVEVGRRRFTAQGLIGRKKLKTGENLIAGEG